VVWWCVVVLLLLLRVGVALCCPDAHQVLLTDHTRVLVLLIQLQGTGTARHSTAWGGCFVESMHVVQGSEQEMP
jgi:hypothetical protein